MTKILPLVLFPDPLLKQVSQPVTEVDDQLRELMDNMLATMYKSDGIGISAVQIGVLKRVLVMDTTYDNRHYHEESICKHDHECEAASTNPIFMVNPRIVKKSAETAVLKEGCLSFPELRADVVRPKSVTVEFIDYHGNPQTMDMDGLDATCVQHEIDHLDGITFVDHLSRLKREMLLKKITKKSKH